jgi:hypothetical protein
MQLVEASLRLPRFFAVSPLRVVSTAGLIVLLLSGEAYTSSAEADDDYAVTRSDILQRIRDEVMYYQLSVYYLRGIDTNVAMDSEHPISIQYPDRDPMLNDPKIPVLDEKECNINWFDFDVTSAEVVLLHTGNKANNGAFGVNLPIPGLPADSVGKFSIGGSRALQYQTSDDLKMAFLLDPAAVEKRVHPPSGDTSRPSLPQDVYPDALRCSTLRYHQQLRLDAEKKSKDDVVRTAAKVEFDQVEPDVETCRKVQNESVAQAN